MYNLINIHEVHFRAAKGRITSRGVTSGGNDHRNDRDLPEVTPLSLLCDKKPSPQTLFTFYDVTPH